MAKQFINPNLHVVLVHFPLALLVFGTLIETFAIFGWRRSAFRAGGRWMILLGALTAAPTATSGLYALYDVNLTPQTSPEERPDVTWAEIRAASPITPQAWHMLSDHAWLAAIGSAIVLLTVVVWLGSSDPMRSWLHLAFLILLIGGVGTMLSAAWHGGEMVYRQGVGVYRVQPPAQGDQAESPAPRQVTYYVPPLQTHVTLAGAALALALVSIGLTLRSGAQARVMVEPTPELADIGAALNPNLRPRNPIAAGGAVGMGAAVPGYNEAAAMQVRVLRQPVARFWLLAALIAVTAGLSGWWTLADRSSTYNVNDLWHQVIDPARQDHHYRRAAHGVVTGGIVFLLLMLALVSRLAVGRRVVLGFFSLLAVGFFALQLWLGSTLMFDSFQGPLVRFNGTGGSGAEPATMPSVPEVPRGAPPSTSPTSTPTPASAPVATR